MHELSIAQSLLAAALEQANKRHATRIAAIYFTYSDDLDISHLEWTLRMVSQGTKAEGAQLCARVDGCGGGGAALEGLDVDVVKGPLVPHLSEPGDYTRGGPALRQG